MIESNGFYIVEWKNLQIAICPFVNGQTDPLTPGTHLLA